MADEREKAIGDLIKFEVAEQVMLDLSLERMSKAATALKEAVDKGNGFDAMQAWNSIGEQVNYIGTLLNLKGHSATREWMRTNGVE